MRLRPDCDGKVTAVKGCSKCGGKLSVDSAAKGDGGKPRSVCKPCAAAYMREYNQRPDRKVEVKLYNQRYKQKNGGRDYKNGHLKLAFGIDIDAFDGLLARQGFVCAICGRPESSKHSSGKVKSLAVDHCHRTGTIRGLLCISCNNGLGRFKDSPELLRKAAAYLDSHCPIST